MKNRAPCTSQRRKGRRDEGAAGNKNYTNKMEEKNNSVFDNKENICRKQAVQLRGINLDN
jgi:hypothetical protein